MKFLYDLFPIFIFFISYKLWGIYVATGLSIAASLSQVTWTFLVRRKQPEIMHLITLGLILLLGGATLFFQNELFIKWKTTAVYWALGTTFLLSQLFSKKPLIQRMMGATISLSKKAWNRLNWSWVLFTYGMGALNVWVLYNFDTDTWVNFKMYGTLSLTLVFAVLQAIVLTRYLSKT